MQSQINTKVKCPQCNTTIDVKAIRDAIIQEMMDKLDEKYGGKKE